MTDPGADKGKRKGRRRKEEEGGRGEERERTSACISKRICYHRERRKRREESVMKRPYFPIFLDISDKKILVAGGGWVAERRVKSLLLFTENIYVVAPEVTEDLAMLAETGRILWKKRKIEIEDLKEADLVLAATDDPTCNGWLVSECQKKGILVNASHKKELCDFLFPALAWNEQVVAGISSGGEDCHATVEARKQIQKLLEKDEYPS